MAESCQGATIGWPLVNAWFGSHKLGNAAGRVGCAQGCAGETFRTTLKICFVWSFIFLVPVMLYHFWCFLSPSSVTA